LDAGYPSGVPRLANGRGNAAAAGIIQLKDHRRAEELSMPEHDQIYPQPTRELAERRKHLAPNPTAGGAYAHSALALDMIAHFPAEKG
jgi:hypothetical protein